MQKPPKPGPYEDRHLDCQAALEDDLNDLIDRAEAAGWETREAAAAIIDLAANRWLAQTIADLRKILKLSRQQQLHAPGRLTQSLAEHLAIFDALQARDAVRAQQAMHDHLLHQREALRALSRNQQRVRTA